MKSETEDELPVRIVVGQRGWVWVGYYDQHGDEVVLTKALNIHRYGMKKRMGLGPSCAGPDDNLELRPAGTVRMHRLAVIATYDCDAAKWRKVLGDGGNQ